MTVDFRDRGENQVQEQLIKRGWVRQKDAGNLAKGL
jgi:hypothetical protein